jgi:hypothetical protein
MASPTLDRETILQAIRSWPHEEQLELAREIARLADAATDISAHASFEDARGLLETPGKPTPTDEDIERWRMEKYGEA